MRNNEHMRMQLRLHIHVPMYAVRVEFPINSGTDDRHLSARGHHPPRRHRQ
jgi:hypothetical protein